MNFVIRSLHCSCFHHTFAKSLHCFECWGRSWGAWCMLRMIFGTQETFYENEWEINPWKLDCIGFQVMLGKPLNNIKHFIIILCCHRSNFLTSRKAQEATLNMANSCKLSIQKLTISETEESNIGEEKSSYEYGKKWQWIWTPLNSAQTILESRKNQAWSILGKQ